MTKKYSIFNLKTLFIALIMCFISVSINAQDIYTTQTGNFNTIKTENTNGDYFAGAYNNTGTEVGIYANGSGGTFIGNPGAALFRTFTINGADNSATSRPMRVGDEFTITAYVGNSSNFFGSGNAGIAFNGTTANSNFSDYLTANRLQFRINKDGNWFGNASSPLSGYSTPGQDVTFKFKLVTPNRIIATIIGSNGAITSDVLLTGTTDDNIESFAIWNQTSGNSNDMYWKNASLTATGTIELGASNNSFIVASTIRNGLQENSVSTPKTNNLTKEGIGTVTLSGDNSYTGTTTINSGTLRLQGSLISSDVIVKNGATLVIDDNLTVKSIAVEAGGYVKVNTGKNLTLTNDLTLESTSTLYSSLISDGTITGTVNYERFVNTLSTGTGGNDLISLPLMPTGLTFDAFIANGENATEIASNGTHYAFAPYNNITVSAYENLSIGATDVLLKAKGYRVATNSGDLLTFTGTPDTGTVTSPIVSTGSKWNLIGNPYPSYVDASAFLTTNTAILESSAVAIYAYNSGIYAGSAPTTSNFTVINKATIATLTGENFNIAPGQGFFVASNAIGGAIEFTPAMRTLTGQDDYIAGRTSNENEFFKLNLIGSETYSTSIFFNANASLGLDPGYDAAVYGEDSENYPIYSHLVEENTGRSMAIQAIENTGLTSISIPLGVNANQSEAITFSIDASNLSSTTLVYLEDTVANTSTLLNSGDYTLTPSINLSGTGRFFLRLTDTTLSTTADTLNLLSIYSNQSKKTIVIAGQLVEATAVNVYDMQGRLVNTTMIQNTNSLQTFDVSNLKEGIYIVQLHNTIQSKTQKIIIR